MPVELLVAPDYGARLAALLEASRPSAPLPAAPERASSTSDESPESGRLIGVADPRRAGHAAGY